MTIAFTFIPASLTMTQEMIPMVSRALTSQRRIDDMNGIEWPSEWIEAAETLATYADVISNAQSATDDEEVQVSSDEGSNVAEVSSDVGSYDMDLTDYAALNDISESYAARLARQNQIDALKVGGRWKIRVTA
jgi:hypothetical protein